MQLTWTSEGQLGLPYKVNQVQMKVSKNFTLSHFPQILGFVICGSLSIWPSVALCSFC